MCVKISFADFLSIYENLTFKSRANEWIRWFCILSFGSIWRCFEATRRCFVATHFLLVARKKYGDSYWKIQNCLHFHKRGSCKHPHLDKVSDSGRSHTIRNTVDQVIKNDKPRTSVAFSFPVCVSSVRVNTKTNWPKKKFVKISVAIFWEVFRSYFALRQM